MSKLIITVCFCYTKQNIQCSDTNKGQTMCYNERHSSFHSCSQNALFETGSYYKSNATEFSPNVYWLNNFDNIYQSYGKIYEHTLGQINETYIILAFFNFS